MTLFRFSPRVLAALCLTAAAAFPAYALPADAGSTDAGPADGVTTAEDVTSADGGSSDVASGDVASGDATASGPITACWMNKCATEYGTCAKDADCLAFVNCNYDTNCIKAIAGGKLSQGSADAGTALQKCGGKNCTDTTGASCKGICGKFVSADPCHCDEPCKDYGDCCKDFDTICAPTTCKQSDCAASATGQFADGSDSSCSCDSACDGSQTPCCDDFATTCKGKTPACTPACTNKDGSEKKCGPDNCGGTCGTCAKGETCTNKVLGICSGADAGSTGDATVGTDGSGTGTTNDTASTTGTTGGSGGSAKTSGCTASTSGSSASVLFGALLAAGMLLRTRRRV